MKRFFSVFIILSFTLTLFCAAAPANETGHDAQEIPVEAVVSLTGGLFITDEEFTAALNVNAVSLRGGSVKLVYDTSKMTAVSVSCDEESDLKVSFSFLKGAVKIVFYNSVPYTGAFRAADITFKVKNGVENENLSVGFEEATVSDGKNEAAAKTYDYTSILMFDIQSDDTDDVTETDAQTDGETEKTPSPTVTNADTTEKTPQSDITDTDKTTEDIQTQTDTDKNSDTSDTAEPTDTDKLTGTEKEPDENLTEDTLNTTEGEKRTTKISTMPVIITVICVAAAGAAGGVVFLIKHSVKKNKKSI